MNQSYSKETVDVKFDNICETLERIETNQKDGFKNLNGRVRTLEKFKIALTTAIIILGAMNIPNLSAIAKTIASGL